MKNGFILAGLAVLSVLLLLAPAVPSSAATAPGLTPLLTIGNLDYPGRVVADSMGNIYVADTVNYKVRVYNAKGEFRRAITLPSAPLSMAISPNNRLFVGQRPYAQGSLDVFELDGTHVGAYQIGATPLSIAFLSTGQLYVVDGASSRVKIYNSLLSKTGEFGMYGTTAGKFLEPKSIAINETAGEIYVLDRGQAATESGYSEYVWRVQVFNPAGTYIRSFSQYGYGAVGKVGKASTIDVDPQGRIYVADSEQSQISVYDAQGVYLSVLYDSTNLIRMPLSICFANDRMYVAAKVSKQVRVWGVDAYGALRVAPADLSIPYQEGMGGASGTTVLYNDGAGQVSWQASTSTPWITLAETSGSVAGGAQQDFAIGVNAAGLPLGTHTGSVDIVSASGSETVSVTLEVAAAPALTVTPGSLSVQVKTNEPVAPMGVSIELSNDLTGTMMWQAVSDAPWLNIDQTSGPSNTLVAANVNVLTSLAPGDYAGTIVVSADGAVGSPATVVVNMHLDSSGKITVTTNTASASFTISGPATYTGSGTTWEVTNIVDGDYTITYDPVTGFKVPAPETKTLAAGGEIVFNGDYTDLREQQNIVASHGPGSKESSEVTVYRADGTAVLTFQPFTSSYGASTAVGDVDGNGTDDILAGAGPTGSKIPARVRGFMSNGTAIPGLDFLAFSTDKGVLVSAGDFDGDGKDEIVAAQPKTNSSARIFSYTGGTVVDTGVNIVIGGGNSPGLMVAAGDLNGDGKAELAITVQDVALVPVVEIYRIDTAAGMGSWTATLEQSYTVCDLPSASSIAMADMNADAAKELLAVCPAASGTEVRIYSGQGAFMSSFQTGSVLQDYIAAGDTDMDGVAEVIVGDAPVNRATQVKVFNAQGALIRSFSAFRSSFGVRVSSGNLGY